MTCTTILAVSLFNISKWLTKSYFVEEIQIWTLYNITFLIFAALTIIGALFVVYHYRNREKQMKQEILDLTQMKSVSSGLPLDRNLMIFISSSRITFTMTSISVERPEKLLSTLYHQYQEIRLKGEECWEEETLVKFTTGNIVVSSSQ